MRLVLAGANQISRGGNRQCWRRTARTTAARLALQTPAAAAAAAAGVAARAARSGGFDLMRFCAFVPPLCLSSALACSCLSSALACSCSVHLRALLCRWLSAAGAHMCKMSALHRPGLLVIRLSGQHAELNVTCLAGKRPGGATSRVLACGAAAHEPTAP